MSEAEPILVLTGLCKSYGPVSAVRDVDLALYPGEVVAICGDNGAGKSSLIKMISGAESPSGGTMRFKGREVAFSSPQDALAQGIATLYQDLALAPRLPIYANVFMGMERQRRLLGLIPVLDKGAMRAEAQALLRRLSVEIDDMDRPVERLSGGQRQAVAISRALCWQADIIIMDEPTAALGVRETGMVLALIGRLKAEGHTVILISHAMRDVAAMADRVVVLRGGVKVEDRPVAGLSADDLSHLIMGTRATAARAHA